MRKTYVFKRLNSEEKKGHVTPSGLHTYIHPCVINNQPHIVYPRGLQEKSPCLFSQLTQHYQNQGYVLKEDQRSARFSNKYKNQRKKWAPVLLFTASLIFESSAFADIEINVNEDASFQKQQNIELQLISNNKIREQVQYAVKPASTLKDVIQIKSELAQRLFGELKDRYKKKNSDPEYIIEDLKEIANYYSDFPESVALIDALKDKNWMLSFDEHNWVTTGSGNMFQVDKAVIHFNTRSAAQLRLNNGCADNPVCIVSPADALLHELLHTHSMLVKGEEFIVQGGMNNVLYPYKHEYAVIDAERELYARMSTQDKIKRPQRREHTGRTVKANCPTCIK
ncbi:MAG: hypothetical protein KAT06_03660 [Gammaproteobacteria bacterium]|nr:hypothetical protein [Gammaproteobacteria bacterium]